jgi:acyl-coenzyme A synthetase/AMP-(fatty) acid ligase
VSSDGLRLSGYEFLGLVEYAANVMAGNLGISAGDVVGIRTFQGPVGLAIRCAAFSLGDIDATVFIQSEQFHLHQLAQDMLAQHFPTLHLAVVVLPAIPLTGQGKPNRLALSETRARDAAS